MSETGAAALWALVVDDAADGRRAGEVVVVFVSPREADEFGRRHGLEGQVVPVRFAVQMDPALAAGTTS